MAVDISKVFRANVKAIRINLPDEKQNKSEALNQDLNLKAKKNNSRSEKNFMHDLKNILVNISILKEFLNENKKFYIQPNYLISLADDLNDAADWQKFEDEAESIIRKCADAIRQLKDKIFSKENYTAQYREHLENIFYLLEKYLKDVCKFYSEQKAIRVKRVVDKKNFSQLCSNDLSAVVKLSNQANLIEDLEKEEKERFLSLENELSPDELQALEKENEALFDNLSIQHEEIKKIESQVIEVSKLTQIFAENIVSQVSSIERIQKSALDTNSNLTIGNENIKEAMKKNAEFRIWILFIILVLSFTLLFLDWYND